jgi:hypothetical protein
MNFKALITTLVLGSSSAAMADSFTVSGSVNVSLGSSATTRPAPAPVYRPVVVAADDCTDDTQINNRPDPRPAYHPTQYHPTQPVWRGPYYSPTNTVVAANASQYVGWVATSPVKFRRMGYGRALVLRQTASTTWFDLTEATRIDSRQEYFKIGADKGVFKALKLQALGGGSSRIEKIAIQYTDASGHVKFHNVTFNTRLDARTNPAITINMPGGYSSIDGIMVIGSTDRGSAYKLLAM